MAEAPPYREIGRLERADVEGTTAEQRKAMRKPENIISRATRGDAPVSAPLVEEMLANMRVLDKSRKSRSALPSGTVRVRHSREVLDAAKFFSKSFQGGVRGILEWPGSKDFRYKENNWKELKDAAQLYLKGQQRQKAAKAKIKEGQGSERPFVDFSEKPLRQTIKRTKAVRDKK